jgi:hypothetical protein
MVNENEGGGEIDPGEKKVCWLKKSRRLFSGNFPGENFSG